MNKKQDEMHIFLHFIDKKCCLFVFNYYIARQFKRTYLIDSYEKRHEF